MSETRLWNEIFEALGSNYRVTSGEDKWEPMREMSIAVKDFAARLEKVEQELEKMTQFVLPVQ